MKKIINYILSPELRLPLLIASIGLTFRIFLMPLAAHLDLWSVIHTNYYWIRYDMFKIHEFADVLQASYLRLVEPIFYRSALPTIFQKFYSAEVMPIEDILQLSSHPLAMRVIFFSKLPYLFFDLGIVLLLFKIFKKRKEKIIAILIWAFHPLIIYPIYLLGRYEIYSMFFVFWAIYLAKENKAFWSILVLGIAVAFRFPAILVLPFFVIYFSQDWKDVIKYTLIGLTPWFVSSRIMSIWGPSSTSFFEYNGFNTYFFSTRLGTLPFSVVVINVITYPILLWSFFLEKTKGLDFKKLIYFSLATFLVIFSFSFFHPQYLSWIAPYFLVAMVMNNKIIIPFILSFIAVFFLIDLSLGTTVTTGLFMPINPEIAKSLPAISELPFDGINIEMAHSFYVLFNLVIVIILFREIYANKKK